MIWPSSAAVSTPGRALAAQYRTASDPYRSRRSAGVTTLPVDFDIFFRSGSSTQPEISASRQGSTPCSSSARNVVEKSQVRMISWACGRRSNGNTRVKRSSSTLHRPAICGVSDDVAQVSMMSTSPVKPPGTPRWSAAWPGGTSTLGSTGRLASSGTSTAS